MPEHIPKVEEIGASSAPLMSAAYFIGARCRPYNDDYMQCKTEAYGRGELECMKEGRKVTRCAASVYGNICDQTNLPLTLPRLKDLNEKCLESFRRHWQCLDNNNHQLWQCRRAERLLNGCVLDNIVGVLPQAESAIANERQGLEKNIPDTPKGDVPIHLRDRQIFADRVKVLFPGEKDVGIMKDTTKS